MRKPVISVIGDSRMRKGSRKWKLATSLGQRLVDRNYRIITGGLGDLPRAIAEGASRSKQYHNGDLIAILPGFDPKEAGEYIDIVIASGLDQARNMIVANSDAVVAIGGGAGTLSEIAFAWSLKRLVLAYRVEGWSGRLAGTRIDSRRRYRGLPDDQVYPVDTEEDVIHLLSDLLPLYNQRHNRIAVRRHNSKME